MSTAKQSMFGGCKCPIAPPVATLLALIIHDIFTHYIAIKMFWLAISSKASSPKRQYKVRFVFCYSNNLVSQLKSIDKRYSIIATSRAIKQFYLCRVTKALRWQIIITKKVKVIKNKTRKKRTYTSIMSQPVHIFKYLYVPVKMAIVFTGKNCSWVIHRYIYLYLVNRQNC